MVRAWRVRGYTIILNAHTDIVTLAIKWVNLDQNSEKLYRGYWMYLKPFPANWRGIQSYMKR